MNVICLGLSHHTAHVELREKFAFPEADITNAISRLGTMDGIREMVIVSTCNRVELYVAVEDATRGFQSIERFLADRCGIHEHDGGIFYRHHSPQSVRHLFRVVSGLESMVLGETEILGQVKKAYSLASENGGTSRHLNKLFQRAFRVAKEVALEDEHHARARLGGRGGGRSLGENIWSASGVRRHDSRRGADERADRACAFYARRAQHFRREPFLRPRRRARIPNGRQSDSL